MASELLETMEAEGSVIEVILEPVDEKYRLLLLSGPIGLSVMCKFSLSGPVGFAHLEATA